MHTNIQKHKTYQKCLPLPVFAKLVSDRGPSSVAKDCLMKPGADLHYIPFWYAEVLLFDQVRNLIAIIVRRLK